MTNSFIFQSVPERFDLRTQLQPGTRQTWYATRYTGLMGPGDVVFFWMGGPLSIRGLYGWGRLLGEPLRRPEWASDGVDASVEYRLHAPLLATRIAVEPGLGNLFIARLPQGTNFLLSGEEADALAELLRRAGERAPELHLNAA